MSNHWGGIFQLSRLHTRQHQGGSRAGARRPTPNQQRGSGAYSGTVTAHSETKLAFSLCIRWCSRRSPDAIWRMVSLGTGRLSARLEPTSRPPCVSFAASSQPRRTRHKISSHHDMLLYHRGAGSFWTLKFRLSAELAVVLLFYSLSSRTVHVVLDDRFKLMRAPGPNRRHRD